MERRDSDRAFVILKTEIISGDNTYGGVIKNFSEKGMYVETIPTKEITDFAPGKEIRLKFKPPEGEPIRLGCEVVWLNSKKLEHGLKQNNIGLAIIEPSSKYKRFFQSLPQNPLPDSDAPA